MTTSKSPLAIGSRPQVATQVGHEGPLVEWNLDLAVIGLAELIHRTGVTSAVTRLATNTATLHMNMPDRKNLTN